MADQPIGISFIPSAQNQANGPQNLAADGGTGRGSTDLAQAYKVLSLRLPQVVGASAPTPQSNLTSAGSAGLKTLPGGLDPHAALFQAFIKAMLGGSVDPSAMGGVGAVSAPSSVGGDPNSLGAGSELPGAMTPPPRTVPKIQFPDQTAQSAAPPDSGRSAGGYDTPSQQPDNRMGYY